MRYLFLPILLCLPALFAIAQDDIPQGPSPLVVVNSDETTNATAKIELGARDVPEEYSPPSLRLNNDVIAVEKPANTASSTNAVAVGASTSFLMDMGVQYEDEGEYAEAEQAYVRALEKSPDHPDTLFRLSTLYIQMKRYAEAVKILTGLGDRFPENAMVHNNLAWIYATGNEMKNGPQALRHAREALLITPYAPSIWNTLAEAYYVNGKYEEALRSSAHAFDLLKSQEGTKEAELLSFQAQYQKLLRASEAYKQMLNLGDEK
jgi:tetratricopeptide (TPR) repeat protein